jgi:hypothetical protein
MANWYCSSVGWTAVTAWAASTAYNVGDIRRQLAAPTVGNERVWRCTTAGTSGGSEPAWTLTKGSTTNDNTVVWTEITGNETYNQGTFAAPHARLVTAVSSSWAAAGDRVYVANNHAATQSTSLTITSAGTVAAPMQILCINATFTSSGGGGPVAADLTTGASESCTGATTLGVQGAHYCYGVQFNSGSGANSSPLNLNGSALPQVYENCGFKHGGSGSSSAPCSIGPTGSGTQTTYVKWINCTYEVSNAAQGIDVRYSRFEWVGGSVVGAVQSTNLFHPSSAVAQGGLGHVIIRDVDLSALGTGKNLTKPDGFISNVTFQFINCKLSASLGSVMNGTIQGVGSPRVDLVNTDSGGATYREEHYDFGGSCVHVTAQVRTGGATDGTTAKSWKVVTLTTPDYMRPFSCPDIYQWVDSTGSKTITMYIASGGTLQDQDVGFEVDYMGDASTPKGTFDTTRPSILTAGSNLATDGSTWSGSGVGTVQKVTKTVTLNQKGLVRVRPFVRKASATVYIDPLLNVA